MDELQNLIIYAIIVVLGSFIIECNSIHLWVIGEIDLPIFLTYQLSIGCLLSLLYLEYYDYKN